MRGICSPVPLLPSVPLFDVERAQNGAQQQSSIHPQSTNAGPGIGQPLSTHTHSMCWRSSPNAKSSHASTRFLSWIICLTPMANREIIPAKVTGVAQRTTWGNVESDVVESKYRVEISTRNTVSASLKDLNHKDTALLQAQNRASLRIWPEGSAGWRQPTPVVFTPPLFGEH
jgi:hypothetical protein